MGIHGIRLSSLLLIAFIAILIFGTKRLRTLGEDLGIAIENFRKGMEDEKKSERLP